MHELIPTATVMALLVNPTNPALMASTKREVQAAADILGLQLHIVPAQNLSSMLSLKKWLNFGQVRS
jgi:hypothetical protein